jgi:hypothetical protein
MKMIAKMSSYAKVSTSNRFGQALSKQ